MFIYAMARYERPLKTESKEVGFEVLTAVSTNWLSSGL
jgi:hypothetical protein